LKLVPAHPVAALSSFASVTALALLASATMAQTSAPVASLSTSAIQPSTAQPARTAQITPAAQTTPMPQTALVAQNAWVRATPGTDIAAAYLTLRNVSTSAVTVTGVESPIAAHAMMHETKVEGGQSKMRPHEQLVVAPGATVKLEPGGLHVMLHDLRQPLVVGQTVPLVILLADGSRVRITAAVRPLGAE
jgi:periplasmic copper chaperone A